MKYFKIMCLVFVTFLFSGCISYQPTLPKGYSGEKAYIQDSAIEYSNSKADMFYLEEINDGEIYNSRYLTMDENHGRGLFMVVKLLNNEIPAKKAKFIIVGRTHYAAPILDITNTVYEIRGEVEFTPKKNTQYVIKGSLKENASSVWIENYETKEVVGNKIEVKGSTALGFFEK